MDPSDVGGIVPAHPVSQPLAIPPTVPSGSPMVGSCTSSTSRSSHGPVQEEAGEDDGCVSTPCLGLDEYYDVMVVGMSGMGKSTTSDKMIIAKLTDQLDPQLDGNENEPVIEGAKFTKHKLTFWTAGGLPENMEECVAEYLKNLHFYGVLKDSHLEVNKSRKDQDVNPITSSCQLVSNEVNGMRVLDVPGFFSVQAEEPALGMRQPVSRLEEDIHTCTHNHLAIMREILRIQSTMNVAFRRILYFLPVRGPLGRQTRVLRQDLFLLAQYFGPTIFECMVLIATIQPRLSVMNIPGGLFSVEECEATRITFKETLESVLSSYPRRAPLSPPVVFVSLLDTGKSIVEKIKTAEVEEDYLELSFDPGVCVKCAITIRWLEKEKVGCIPVGGKGNVIPYGDSYCHPIFLPRNRRPHKIEVEGRVTYIVLSPSKEGRRAAQSSEEICHNCKQPPGSEGCMKVGDPYLIAMVEGEDTEIKVDHTNHIEEHRGLDQSTEVVPEDEGADQEGGVAGREERAAGKEKRSRGRKKGIEVRKKRGDQGRRKREGRDDRGRGKGEGGVRLEEEPQGILLEEEEEEDPTACRSPQPVSMAEDDGNATSEMVMPSRRTSNHTGPNSHKPCDQSLLEEAGLADVKG